MYPTFAVHFKIYNYAFIKCSYFAYRRWRIALAGQYLYPYGWESQKYPQYRSCNRTSAVVVARFWCSRYFAGYQYLT